VPLEKGRAAVVRNVVALVACIAVAMVALDGHEPSPPGTPPGPVELAAAEERTSVVDDSPRERGTEPRRREAVRRYEPARRGGKRHDRARRRPQTSRPASRGVRAVADVADPSRANPLAGAGSPSSGRDEGAGARSAPPAGGQQRPGGAAPRAPRQDATVNGNAPAPAPPPPPPPPAAVPAAPSVNTGVDEPTAEVVGGAEEIDDDVDALSPDD
jgi:hypothetical protein